KRRSTCVQPPPLPLGSVTAGSNARRKLAPGTRFDQARPCQYRACEQQNEQPWSGCPLQQIKQAADEVEQREAQHGRERMKFKDTDVAEQAAEAPPSIG